MASSTIKDVARRAGVSTATVSRVINNEGNVKAANVKRVMDAVEECNFVPNFIARNLKISKTNTIGFLVSDISNPYFTAMAKVVETYLDQCGYDMLICSTDEDPLKETGYLKRFLSNHVDGIILNTTNLNNDFVVQLSHSIPIVLIERQVERADFTGDFVGSDNFGGVHSMTQYLLRLGHRKIGLINSELKVNTGAERLKGFVQAMLAANIRVDASYPYQYESAHFDYEGGFEGAKALMSLPEPPTALIATNNTLSLGALGYLRAENICIPDDVSFFSYGNIINGELLHVDLSYSTLNPYALGERAAQLLTSRIDCPEATNRQAVFESQLVCRNSVKPL